MDPHIQSVEDFFGVKSKLASFEKDTSKEVNTINSRTTQLGFVAKLTSYHFKLYRTDILH